jgi:hypothetical protein
VAENNRSATLRVVGDERLDCVNQWIIVRCDSAARKAYSSSSSVSGIR